MKAIWGEDYDFLMDRSYRCPVCPECEEPVGKMKDGKYHCFSCGEEVDIDPKMAEWFAEREGEKVEMLDCPVSKYGVRLGCGGKGCVETHYRKNKVTREWYKAWSVCKVCGIRTIT